MKKNTSKKIIKEYANDLEQKVALRTQELLEREKKLLQAQKTVKLGTWEWHVEKNEVVWSEQLYENFDVDKNIKVTMQVFYDAIHPEDLDRVQKQIKKTEKSGIAQAIKFRVISSKGDVRYMQGFNEAILNEKKVLIKMSGIVQDVTELQQAENLKMQVNAVMQGQEMERERIAADLHDSINALLSIANLNIESLLAINEEKKSYPKEKLENTIELLKNAMLGIKEISSNLSPAILKNFGLKKALEHLSNKVRASSPFKIDYQVHGSLKDLDINMELHLYRITQELLNNIIRHAEATEVEVQLIRHNGTIILMVSDNGVGFDAPVEKLKTNGYGFRNINSRVVSLNGSISFDSTKGKGTTVTIELPI